MSVAELCRRLGSTTGSGSSSAAPVLVGDLLRREGRPPVPEARIAPRPEPELDDDQPVVPTPRSRGDACRTALGAGGLVVAGSVLGAALLAAAGVGGPLPFGQGGDDAAGQFQGEGTLVKPGTAYGSVRGRDVVARSGLLRAIAYYVPFGSSGAADGAGTRVAAAVPGARPAVPVQAIAPAGAATFVTPATDIGTPAVGGSTHAVPVITPLANGVATAVTPIADLGGTVIAPVIKPVTPVVEAAAPLVHAAAPVIAATESVVQPIIKPVTPVVEAAAPLVHAAAPVIAATESVVQPVLAVTGPAVAPALGAAGPVLDLADPLLTPLPGDVTDPIVAGDLPAVPGSFAQAAAGNAVSAVQDAAVGTTSAVQAATDTARQVLPSAPSGTVGRVVARTQTPPEDLPTLPLPIVAPQATSSAVQAAADTAGVLTKVVPVQATDSPEPAVMDTTLPTQDLSSLGVAVPEKTEAQTKAEAEPPTEPLRIVAPRDDPEPSVEPRTAPLRIVGPETSGNTRAESEPDAPAPRRIPAADALTDKADALLGR